VPKARRRAVKTGNRPAKVPALVMEREEIMRGDGRKFTFYSFKKPIRRAR
jgi:hypothetical protein